MSTFADFALEVYLAGTTDSAAAGDHALPFTVDDLRVAAARAMTPAAFAYVDGSAGGGATARANRSAFGRYALNPRVLRSPGAGCDLGITLWGKDYPSPVLTAPVGVLEQVHEDAELALARGANASGVPVVLSSVSSTPMEEVAAVVDRWWFQLYLPADDAVAESFVRRATAAGAEAIVITADAPRLGWRPRDLEFANLPFLHARGMANYLSDPGFAGSRSADTLTDPVRRFLDVYGHPGLDVGTVARVRAWTDLPVLVKGVTRVEEAEQLVALGVDGLVVSNHGGRQLDNTVAALEMLPRIVTAVGDSTTVLFDSGIRSGADVAVALALGARAVLVGRPWVYGLGVAGQGGVAHVLRCLLAELQISCELLGADARDLSLDDVVGGACS